MLLRSIWFMGVVIAGAAGPWWALCLLGIPYLLYYTGLELLFVALLIDGYFGFERTDWPMYTVITFALMLMVQFLRPYISVYNR